VARAPNGGIVLDNVGPDGTVGSLLDGRWYGGHYGWSWPHGRYSVGSAAAVAALAAGAVTGDDGYLDLLRPALDMMIENGKVMAFTESDSSRPYATPPAQTAPGSAACTTTGTASRRSPSTAPTSAGPG
jgi:hypothetical protein